MGTDGRGDGLPRDRGNTSVAGVMGGDGTGIAPPARRLASSQQHPFPPRLIMQCLHERAIADFPIVPELWQAYCRWLETVIKTGTAVLPAYARATRNCPWVGALWAARLAAMERLGGGDAAGDEAYQEALTAGMQVCAAVCFVGRGEEREKKTRVRARHEGGEEASAPGRRRCHAPSGGCAV